MKPRVPFLLTGLGALLCALVLVPFALADSQARIVRLSFIDGTVQIDRATGQWEKAIMNMPIVQGTKLATDQNGRTEVEFEDGSTIRLGPDAEVDFTELGLRDDGGKINAVEVRDGTVYFDIAHRKDDEFRVAFAADEIKLDRAARFRITVTETKVELAVLKGDVKVNGPEEVAVKSGQTLSIDPENGKFEVAKGVAEDALDNWVKSREQYRNTYASNASYGAPYSGYYGVSDLNYYGNYFYQSGWGWLWRPYYVSSGWDPFYDGAWCWYPGYGYTWVSTYPWGWIPYRYGAWVYVPGWGWAWQPGGWGNWWRVPRVINPPPAYKPPQPPVQPVAGPVVPGGPPRTRDGNPIPPPRIRAENPTILIRAREMAGDNPVTDFTPRRPASGIRVVGPIRTDQSGTEVVQPGRRVGVDNTPVRTRTTDRDSDSGVRQTPPSRVDRPAAPPRVEPSSPPARVERPSPPVERPSSPPTRVERPSSPPPRMETPRGAPPPRMEAPRSAPPPAAPRMESRPSSPSRPIK